MNEIRAKVGVKPSDRSAVKSSLDLYLKLFEQYTTRIQWVLLTLLVLGGVLAARLYIWHFGYQAALDKKAEAILLQTCEEKGGPRCDSGLLLEASKLYAAPPPASAPEDVKQTVAWLNQLDTTSRAKILLWSGTLATSTEHDAAQADEHLPVLGVSVSAFDLLPIEGIFIVILLGWLFGLSEHIRVLASDLVKRLRKSDLQSAGDETHLMVTRALPAHLVLFWPSTPRARWLQSALVYFSVGILALAMVSDLLDLFVARNFPFGHESVLTQIQGLSAKSAMEPRNAYVLGLLIKELATLVALVIGVLISRGANRRIREVVGMVAVLRWPELLRRALEKLSSEAASARNLPAAHLSPASGGDNQVFFAPDKGRESERWPLQLRLKYSSEAQETTLKCDIMSDFGADVPALVASSREIVEYFMRHLRQGGFVKSFEAQVLPEDRASGLG